MVNTGVTVLTLASVALGLSACGSDGGKPEKPATAANPVALDYGQPQTKVVLQVWDDTRCPFCKSAQLTFGAIAKEYADAGKIRIEYREVNRVDELAGGKGSLVGGNALACAHDTGQAQYMAYRVQLFANQPPESDDSYGSPATLLDLASRVPGLRSASFDQCVNSGTHGSWVIASGAALRTALAGRAQVPTYFINGTHYSINSRDDIDKAQAAFRVALDTAVAATK